MNILTETLDLIPAEANSMFDSIGSITVLDQLPYGSRASGWAIGSQIVLPAQTLNSELGSREALLHEMAHAFDHQCDGAKSAREPFGLGRIPDRNELHQGIHEDFPSAYAAKAELSFEARQKEDYAETVRVVLENLDQERLEMEQTLIDSERKYGANSDHWGHLSLVERKKMLVLQDLGQI